MVFILVNIIFLHMIVKNDQILLFLISEFLTGRVLRIFKMTYFCILILFNSNWDNITILIGLLFLITNFFFIILDFQKLIVPITHINNRFLIVYKIFLFQINILLFFPWIVLIINIFGKSLFNQNISGQLVIIFYFHTLFFLFFSLKYVPVL